MKIFILRLLIFSTLWAVVAWWGFENVQKDLEESRFEFLILSNGRVASVQRERLFDKEREVQAGDRIVKIQEQPFSTSLAKSLLITGKDRDRMTTLISRKAELIEADLNLRSYTTRDFLVMFLLPNLVSLIFILFAIFTPFQKFNFRKTREAVEVFSLLCLGLSFYFLLFFPSINFSLPVASSVLLPVLGVLILHLFLVYPKKKAKKVWRVVSLSVLYLISFALMGWRYLSWHDETFWYPLVDYAFVGACILVAMGSLGNTLFTSRDFWTRRRARILSIVFLLSFIAMISVYVSFLWHGPRISLERLLGFSLFFPAGFAFIFSKEDVFNLERIFRRGLHQFLFLGVAILLATLIGLSWLQWGEADSQPWILWAAIAMAVTLFARPVGNFFESRIHRLIQTRVRYPNVGEIFNLSSSVEDFLIRLSKDFERNLSLKKIAFRFSKDPTAPWSDENEQYWRWDGTHLELLNFDQGAAQYRSFLRSTNFLLGEIRYSGGDGIAFDPHNSRDWENVCRDVARCLELLILREYLVTQQSLLAVGRMQALLAHEMKNPLAVIKVCAGILQDRLHNDEDSEECLRTIESEVNRVSHAVQKVFTHSSSHEKRARMELCHLIQTLRQMALARFPDRRVQLQFKIDDGIENELDKLKIWVWIEPEAFQQCLMNLMVNAFEAASPEVILTVELEREKRLRLIVQDRGSGIAPEVELFKPFVSTKAFGTGLGLSQVKSCVERHLGRIYVKSKEGRGAAFYLDFPSSIFVKQEEWVSEGADFMESFERTK